VTEAAAVVATPVAAGDNLLPRWQTRAPRLHVLLAHRGSRVGLGLLILVLGMAFVGPLVAPGDGSILSMLSSRDTGPSWAHPFGTTIQGSDVFSQVLRAAPLTVELTAGATIFALAIAVACGVAAGAFGGRVDSFVSALTSMFLVIPMLPLAIVVAGVLPKQQHTALATMLTIGLASWAPEARVLRAQALSLRSTDFVASARAVGESRWRVVVFEFVPNMTGRVVAGVFFVAIQVTITLATLDFLATVSRGRFALGDTNGTTWGSLLAVAQSQQALLTGSWWAFTFPALALLAIAAGLVLTMLGIEEAADSRLSVLRTARRRLRLSRPALRVPRLQAPELRSPLPALRTLAAATPQLGRHLLRRSPVYALALWVALTVAYALPRLAAHGGLPTRGAVAAPEASGSFWVGYAHFLGKMATGQPGQGVPGVSTVLWNSLPFSLALVGTATLLAFLLGTAVGLVAAWRRGGTFDGVVSTCSAVVWATPTFALAGLAVAFLALRLRLFPIQWSYDIALQPAWSWQFVGSAFRHAQLPLLVLLLSSFGFWMLSMRAVTTTFVNDDYVQFARAKGLSEPRIMVRYAGRNALLPALTGFAVAFSLAIGGIAALEEVFSYSGGGWELQQAAMMGNEPVVQALFVAIAVSVVVVNILVDVVQVLLDPRLRTA
jgi:peptide/nickel transport system permease protein